jgi:HTH-type transcriptional regulator/antitoxin HigA
MPNTIGGLEKMTTHLADIATHWTPIAPLFSIRTENEYSAAVERLNALLDEIGTNESHPLYSLLDTLGTLVHTYEEQHHGVPNATGPEVLQYLMEEHGLSAADLPEFGSLEEVEQYLAGNAELTIDQVRRLAQRFGVSPTAFI